MIGMPAIADIALMLRLLAHLGDHRVARRRGREAVGVDRAKGPREGDMLLRAHLLVAKNTTPYSPKAHRISANSAAHGNAARSTPEISAPTWWRAAPPGYDRSASSSPNRSGST
jgi:hypothetical protein